MTQCRNYMSSSDCAKCFETAAVQIRKCLSANGARVIYDGCILRYESMSFYDQTTLPGNTHSCGSETYRTVQDTVIFGSALLNLVKDLELATPKTSDHYAAIKTELTGGGGNIYGVAQCSETVTETACQECLKVASEDIQHCFPNPDERAVNLGCFLRYSTTPFFADNQTVNIRPFLEQGSSNKRKLITGVAAGCVGLLLVAFALFSWYQLSQREKPSQAGNILGATLLQGPLRYRYKDLKNATENFNEKNKLGEGGFGKVYKGTLLNGDVVAVKKLIVSSSAGRAQFESEVKLISNIHHRNLVRLLGFSSTEAEILLVYEYINHGSLDRFLYGFCLEDSHLSTRFAGTLGYTAPEYAIYGHLSEKVDVYGFGVVIIEIISGRRSTDVKSEPVTSFLLEEAWNLYQQEMQHKLVDATLNPEEYTLEEVKKVTGVALACVQSPASARPSMSSVVAMLSVDRPVDQKLLGTPTFVNAGRTHAMEVSTGSLVTHATASFTQNSGR